MNQELRHFFVQAPMGHPRLASRGLDSDDHIAEKFAALIAVRTFEQRKRQHVGREMHSPVLGIQRRDLVVQYDRDRKFRIRLTHLFEHANGTRPEQARVDPG